MTYLFRKIIESGRQLVGFDLNEVGVGEGGFDANIAARLLFTLCNLMVKSNS